MTPAALFPDPEADPEGQPGVQTGAPATPDADAAGDGLLARCVAGDRAAWRQWHRLYHPVVSRFLYRLGLPEADRDDAAQEVFLQAFRYLPRFKGQADIKTWLYKLCVTQASRLHRRRKLTATLGRWFGRGGPGEAPCPAAPADDGEVMRRLHGALAALKPVERTAFVLFELEGLSGEEIARVQGCPVATVWRRLHYARKAFEAAVRQTDHPRGGKP